MKTIWEGGPGIFLLGSLPMETDTHKNMKTSYMPIPKLILRAWLLLNYLTFFFLYMTTDFRPKKRALFMKDHAVDINWFYKHSKNTTFNCSHPLGRACPSIIRDKICLIAFKLKYPMQKYCWTPHFSFHPPFPPPLRYDVTQNYFQKLGGQSSQVIKPKYEAYSFLIYKLILLGARVYQWSRPR